MSHTVSIPDVLAGRAPWCVEQADCLSVLRAMPDGCVQCLVTSPPYYLQRVYKGVEPSQWPEVSYSPMPGLPPITVLAMECCLGAEPTIWGYIGHLIMIFREAKRVLRPDAVAWVNLGGFYAGGGGGNYGNGKSVRSQGGQQVTNVKNREGWLGEQGLKAKDMTMVPARFALAMQADGWWLRQCVTWAKKTPLPGSQSDRPTTATEDIFLLSKADKYFYDLDACRVPHNVDNGWSRQHAAGTNTWEYNNTPDRIASTGQRIESSTFGDEAGRNLWSWWMVEPDDSDNLPPVFWVLGNEPLKGSHYATFPSEIPRRALKLGTSTHGCCPSCFAPYRRITERIKLKRSRPNEYVKRQPTSTLTGGEYHPDGRRDTKGQQGGVVNVCGNTVAGVSTKTLGWESTCECEAGEPISCLVCDPFTGSGTSGMVARELNLRFVGIELSPDYAEMSRRRIGSVAPLVDAIDRKEAAPVKPVSKQPSLFGDAE